MHQIAKLTHKHTSLSIRIAGSSQNPSLVSFATTARTVLSGLFARMTFEIVWVFRNSPTKSLRRDRTERRILACSVRFSHGSHFLLRSWSLVLRDPSSGIGTYQLRRGAQQSNTFHPRRRLVGFSRTRKDIGGCHWQKFVVKKN